MIKIVLISILLFCAVYGWRQRRVSFLVGAGLPTVCLIGAIFVLRPTYSNQLAGFLGVGRGADLIFYLWMVVSLLLLANIHFRLRAQLAMITVLTREIAIQEAQSADNELETVPDPTPSIRLPESADDILVTKAINER